MKQIEPNQLSDNVVKLIGTDWMLITAGAADDFNTMTASWGGVGYLWNRPVVYVFIRPERHTFKYTERHSHFTLSFFGEQYRKALALCGRVSGRDTDKIAESGLTPIVTKELQLPTFAEARIVIECRKLYVDTMRESAFVDTAPLEQHYGGNHGNLHMMYIAEIVNVWIDEQE